MTPERRIKLILNGVKSAKYPDREDLFFFKNSKWLFDISIDDDDENILWLNHYRLIKPLEQEFNIPQETIKDIVTNIIKIDYIKYESISFTEMDAAIIKKIENDLKKGQIIYITK